jgi:HTH-type transcriptional regulator, sugar sensing transcriptional regulator
MEISQDLEALGFTKNEVRVYLTLLRIGSTMAGRLAREAGLERTSAYNALNRLVNEGVVSYVIESRKKVFHASDPQKIIDMFKEKEARAERLVPKIVALRKFEREREHILKFRGYAGVKTVFNDIINNCKEGEEYLIFGSENQLSTRMPEFAQILVSRKDKKKLRARILLKESMKGTGKKMSEYTKVRFVPKTWRSLVNINVYGSKVALFLWSETPEAIIIDNKDAADTFRSYFEFMWENAHP